ncbi:MAG: hypothetical protein MUE76_05485 [Syntrophales bacterium]|nr:hypothetical protein [Syntrophales bacterium]
MKKTSPWFILLFPVAVPAMIVLDYFGYRVIAFVILAALVVTFAAYARSVAGRFRSLRGEMAALAKALFDDGTGSIRHFPYHHTLSGTVCGHRLHFSLLGHDERALCQIFLECPVSRELLVEAGADPRGLPPGIDAFLSLPGFRNLQALPRKVPFLKRILGGLVGSGGPGLVLRKQGDDPFSSPSLRRDIEMLIRLFESLGGGMRTDGKEP